VGITINDNAGSGKAARAGERAGAGLEANVSRLSSGARINSAADDATGLGISGQVKARTRMADDAERAAGQQASLLQTADRALRTLGAHLGEMQGLAGRAAEASPEERRGLDRRFQELGGEIDRIGRDARHEGRPAFDPGIDRRGLGLAGAGITSPDSAQSALGALQGASEQIRAARSDVGGKLDQVTARLAAPRPGADEQIRDAQMAYETAGMARQQIETQKGVAMLAQANVDPQTALRLLG